MAMRNSFYLTYALSARRTGKGTEVWKGRRDGCRAKGIRSKGGNESERKDEGIMSEEYRGAKPCSRMYGPSVIRIRLADASKEQQYLCIKIKLEVFNIFFVRSQHISYSNNAEEARMSMVRPALQSRMYEQDTPGRTHG